MGSSELTPELRIEDLMEFIKNSKHEYLTAHSKLCFIIIKRIYRRVLNGHRFGGIKIGDKGSVVDGNHRYVAYKLANIEFEIITWTSSHSDLPKSFNEVKIDEVEDWDLNCPDSIKYCTDDFLFEKDSSS